MMGIAAQPHRAQRRRARRDLDHLPDRRRRGVRRPGLRPCATSVTPEQFGLRRARLDGPARRRRRRRTPAMLREVAGRRARAAPRHRPAQRRRGPLHRRGRRRASPRASRRRGRRSPPAPPAPSSTPSSRVTQPPQGRRTSRATTGDFLAEHGRRRRAERVAQARAASAPLARPLPPAPARPPARGARAPRSRRPPAAPAPLAVIAEVKRALAEQGRHRPGPRRGRRRRAPTRPPAPTPSRCSPSRRASAARSSDLRAVAAAVDLPVLRKDFIVDAYQVWEAAEAGRRRRAAHRRRARRRAPADAARRVPATAASTRWSRCTTRTSCERAVLRRRDAGRHQQPRPAHPRGRPGDDRAPRRRPSAAVHAARQRERHRHAGRRPARRAGRRPRAARRRGAGARRRATSCRAAHRASLQGPGVAGR